MATNEKGRICPYCGKILKRPYWVHIQKNHPEEYAKNETWIQLYKDYSSMGMEESMSLLVISELFNVNQDDVRSYLKKNNIL
ncbi:MAG: hypothetical protein ACFFAN_15120 [Promethearchaeota archaeon]